MFSDIQNGKKTFLIEGLYFCVFFCFILYSFWEQFLSFGGGDYTTFSAAYYFGKLVGSVAFLKSFSIIIQVIIIFVSLVIGRLITKPLNAVLGKSKIRVWSAIYITNSVILFVSYRGFESFYATYGFSGISLSFINILFILLLSMVGGWYYSYYNETICDYVYEYMSNKVSRIAYYFVWFLISFMCSGEYLFLSDLNRAWTVNIKTLSLFIMFMLWVKPFIDLILITLEKRAIFGGSEPAKLSNKDNLFIWFLMIIPLAVYFWFAFPAIESADSIYAWDEILNGKNYSYGFPIFVKIVWRVLYSICPSIAIVTVFQCVLWMITIYLFLRLFAKRGMKKKYIYIIAFISCAFTPFNLFVLTHSTNIYYILAMLWATYLLILYFEGVYNKFLWPLGMACCLALLPLTRNEGTITLASLAVFTAIYTVCKRKLLPIVATVFAIVLSLIVKGPVFKAFGASAVSLNDNPGINTLVNDITIATVHFEGKLSDESRALLNKYATNEEIDEMWRNFDYDSWAPEKLDDFIGTNEEVFPVAKDAIIHNIPITIRERLNKSENVWSVTQYKDAVNARRSVNAKENESLLYKILFRVLYYPTFMIPVLDILLYRSGIWLCFMLILSVYLIKNRRGEEMLVYAPAIAHAIVLLLSLLWLCARHTWCINLTGMVLVALAFGCKRLPSKTGASKEGISYAQTI